MRAATGQNTDILALAVCFAICAIAFSSAMSLIHPLAIQSLVEACVNFLSNQVHGALPDLSPLR